jgi:uncharacterized membrane protein
MASDLMTWARGLGLGAGMMYLLDPASGRRRRAVLRDKAVHYGHRLEKAAETICRDAANRSWGAAAEAWSWLGSLVSGPVSDAVLAERVRSRMGRFVCRPSEVQVAVADGRVTLLGSATQAEIDDLLPAVRSVPGVAALESQMTVREPEVVRGQALSGPAMRHSRRHGHRHHHPSHGNGTGPSSMPITRSVVGGLGAAALIYGLGRGGLRGLGLATLGSAALAAGISRVTTRRLLGLPVSPGLESGEIEVRKSIRIDAPIDEVFDFWAHYENFPLFMSHLKEVVQTDIGRSRWTVTGPAGSSVTWNAITTDFRANETIAWESEAGSAVRTRGRVRFAPEPDGTTRIDVTMIYAPPAGMLGHAVAGLLGFDPKSQMDDDLNRLKTALETGLLPRDAARKPDEAEMVAVGAAAPVGVAVSAAAMTVTVPVVGDTADAGEETLTDSGAESQMSGHYY